MMGLNALMASLSVAQTCGRAQGGSCWDRWLNHGGRVERADVRWHCSAQVTALTMVW